MRKNMTFMPYVPIEDGDSSDIIDMVEYRDLDGKVKYLSNIDFDCQHYKDMQELDSLLNQLNKYSKELERGTPDFGLYDSSKKVENLIITDFDSPPESKSIKNYFCKDKIHKFKMNLVRTAVMAGVVLGLTAATNSSSNLGEVKYSNGCVSIEKETANATSNLKKSIGNTIKSEPVKKSKEKLGFIKLDSTDLSYTSMNDGPFVNTKRLKCDSYKAHYAAILDDNNNLIDVIDVSKKKRMSITKFKKNCKKVYGNDINIQLNVDGVINGKVIYNKAGWISIEKSVKYDKKVYIKSI